MAKGWGVCTSHGGGCGAHAGGVDDCQLVGLVMPGKDGKPAGRLIPLLNGANEAPTGFTAGVELGVESGNGCNVYRNLLAGDDFGDGSEDKPGSNSCWNRSRSACCCDVAGAGWGGEPSDLNQAPLPS